MKPVMSAALAIALLGGAAQAQTDQNRQGDDHHKPPPPAQHHPASGQAPAPGARPMAAPVGQPRFTGQGPVNGAPARNGPAFQNRTGPGNNGFQNGAPARNGPAFQNRTGPSNNGFQNGAPAFRGRTNGAPQRGPAFSAMQAQRNQGRSQYNPNQWRRSYFAERRFRGPSFGYPGNWYYQRWAFGEFLPFAWIAPDYYLDPDEFGLPYPPVDAEWVREGPDAVLVDVTTGQVLSVEYGLFY